MKLITVTAALTGLAALVSAKDGRTFAVMHFTNNEICRGRMDPVVSPGVPSSHLHSVMGASNFGETVDAATLKASKCSNALLKGDFSNYWFPSLYFYSKTDKTYTPVDMFYMNVYYFFEGTNDQITAFPSGLKMVSGDPKLRTPPTLKNAPSGDLNLDPSNGPINPVQWTCPRTGFNPRSWPPTSDGTMAGIGDSQNLGSGTGFPFQKCDGSASPLRMDIHFPSCYNPAAGLDDYKNNMAFPSNAGTNKEDCPPGWIHTPHLFYEIYWNTNLFWDQWDVDGAYEPFVLSNGDATGYGSHGDFVAAWDENLLQHIIDTCNAGDGGMDKCDGIQGLNTDHCTTDCSNGENVTGVLTELLGTNPLSGWYWGESPAPPVAVAAKPPVQPPATALTTQSPPATTSTTTTSTSTSTTTTHVQAASPSSPPIADVQQTDANPAPAPLLKSEPPVTPPAMTSAPPAIMSAPPAMTSAPPPVVVQPNMPPSPVPQPDTASACAGIVSTAFVTITVTSGSTAPTEAPVVLEQTSPSSNVAFFGCYKDQSTRVLQGDQLPNLGPMTNDKCVTHCTGEGFLYAGTENGGQCFCGNSLDNSSPLPAATCNTPCEGSATETCGGPWALSVYHAATTPPGRFRRRASARGRAY